MWTQNMSISSCASHWKHPFLSTNHANAHLPNDIPEMEDSTITEAQMNLEIWSLRNVWSQQLKDTILGSNFFACCFLNFRNYILNDLYSNPHDLIKMLLPVIFWIPAAVFCFQTKTPQQAKMTKQNEEKQYSPDLAKSIWLKKKFCSHGTRKMTSSHSTSFTGS